MTTPTFTPVVPPSPGTELKYKAKVLKNDFGDGYSFQQADGLNNIRVELSLRWEILTPTQKESIITFLENQRGYKQFFYTASDDVSRKWTCEEWQYSKIQGGFWTISATFVQRFNLGS